ncbi:O-acetyl-ADP-ribose deacetylase [Chloroflexota bacterium]
MEQPSKQITINRTILTILRGDITTMTTDAIVNAANPGLMGGGGVDGAIHRAGGPAILDECQQVVARQGRLPTGQAVITTGGNLKAKHVIHTVGPVWHGGTHHEARLLTGAYRESLKLAVQHGLTSVAFPSISTGVYGYPVVQAARVAIEAVVSFLKEASGQLEEVVFALFNEDAYQAYRRALDNATANGYNIPGEVTD